MFYNAVTRLVFIPGVMVRPVYCIFVLEIKQKQGCNCSSVQIETHLIASTSLSYGFNFSP